MGILISGFDGTVTGYDFFDRVRKRCTTEVAIVQDALKRSDCVATAGDGRPDLRPALLVQPQLRFARGWLAEALTERGEKFHPFERCSQIADQLQKARC
jgi:2-hydroxy-3-keto-5-methylthiopentenyl-1-phosphate phosphatase